MAQVGREGHAEQGDDGVRDRGGRWAAGRTDQAGSRAERGWDQGGHSFPTHGEWVIDVTSP